MMAYAPIAITIALSGLTLHFWIRFIPARIKHPADLSNAGISDWPALISMVLPGPARRVWHALVLSLCMMVPAGLHFFALKAFWSTGPEPGLHLFYLATLAFWLASLAVPVTIIASHRQARALKGELPEDGGR